MKEELHDSSGRSKQNIVAEKETVFARSYGAAALPLKTRGKCGRDETSVNTGSTIDPEIPIELLFKSFRVKREKEKLSHSRTLFFNGKPWGYFPKQHGSGFRYGKMAPASRRRRIASLCAKTPAEFISYRGW